MTFRIDDELRDKLGQIAKRERRALAWMVEEAVRQLVGRDEAVARSRRKD